MSWEKVSIKDVALGIYDGPHATPPEANSGAIFLGIPNFVNGQLDLTNIRYISEDDYPKWTKRVIPKENDIVFSYEATLNLYAIIPKGFRGCLGRRMALIRPDETKINHKFLYYYFYSKAWRDVISENTVLGATVDRIPLVKFPEFQIEVPPIDIQKRIADILSAYDDLIENNQKQIKLLEEAAQRLYKEWFVDLRFPGHEDVTVVDGVPEGWNRCSLTDVITFNPKVSLDKNRIKQFVPMSALSTNSMVLNSSEYTTTLSNSGSKFQNGDTLLARITPCLENGKTAFVFGIDSDEGAVGSTEYIVMRSKELNPYMVYILARTDDFRQYAVNSMSGSDGRQRVQVDKLMAYPFLRPTLRLIEMFAKLADPIFTQIYTKNEQNIELQKARDLLLPKLMSGELYLAETKKADILQPLPKLSYDEFLSDLGMAARAKTVSEADLRAMYEAYLDDDAEDRD